MQFVQPGMEAATRMVNITDITWNKQHRKKHDWEFVFMNCFMRCFKNKMMIFNAMGRRQKES